MPTNTAEFASWDSSDEIIAHGLGVSLKAAELQDLMRCACKMPAFDNTGICGFCNRKELCRGKNYCIGAGSDARGNDASSA